MIFDQYGKVIPETRSRPPASGIQIIGDPVADRDAFDASRGLTPRDVDRIMMAANGGDVEAQCRLSRELPEKNHDIAHALRTRRNTLVGCKWDVEPGDDSDAAKAAAKAAAEALRSDLDATGALVPGHGKVGSFQQLLRDLSDALLPGFAASEIVWRSGGAGFYGFRAVEQRYFSFTHSYTPKLRVTGNLYDGIELPPGKIIFHELGDNGPDPVRGGLIRPLAWLHCFANINLKDLLSFIERYGMPFVVARVDQGTWEKDGVMLNRLITNFGPSGGGVFSRAVEIELLQAANNTGDVYFRLLKYLGDAVTKVILGQTASSSDGGGLSKDNSQDAVRQDILDADARQLEDTINRDLFAVWTQFNCPPGTASPRLLIRTDPPEDTAALGTLVKTLHEAGLECDPEEVGNRVGLKLTRRAADTVPAISNAGNPQPESNMEELKKKYELMGIAVRAGGLAPTQDIEEQTRRELGLPAMNEAVRKAWEETGGVRRPLTLKTVEPDVPAAPDKGTLQLAENDGLLKPPGALETWLGPLTAALIELSEEGDPAEFRRKLDSLEFGSSATFESELEGLIFGGIAHGAVAAERRLKGKSTK